MRFRALSRPVAIPTLIAFVSSTLTPVGAWANEPSAPPAAAVRATSTAEVAQTQAHDQTNSPGIAVGERGDTRADLAGAAGPSGLPTAAEVAPFAASDNVTNAVAGVMSSPVEGGVSPPSSTAPPSSTVATPGGAAAGAGTGVAPQALALPSGAATVGGMGESFSAQLTTGIAGLSVPFALPGARGAVQPTLGLTYASSGGYGAAGVGWSISGPAFIARQTDRGLPKYDDRADWHPEQDRFLFGSQELVPICLVTGNLDCTGALRASSGLVTEDEVMPAWAAGWQYFRTRVEGAFLRFFWSPDHRTWRIQSKDGIQFELGVPLDGTGYALGLDANPTRPSEIFRWHLVRQYDPHGETNLAAPQPKNVIAFRYARDGGIARLTDIFYTSPAATPQSTDLASFAHHVRLVYGTRPDPSLSFRPGFAQEDRLRLERVDVTSKPFENALASPRELVRRFHLAYDETTHASLLESVQMEGRCAETLREETDSTLPPSSCPRLPKLSFGYERVRGSGDVPVDSQGLAFEKFNQDVQEIAGSPSHSLDAAETSLFDVNADALPDVIVTDPARFDGQHGLFLNGHEGDLAFSSARRMSVTGVTTVDAGVLRFGNTNVAGLDLDGNGIADLLHMPRVKKYSVFEPKLAGSAWTWAGRDITTASGLDAKIDFTQNARRTAVMDVNADGLVDVVFSSSTEIQTFFALGRYPGGDGRFGQAQLTASEAASLSDDSVTTCVPWSATPIRLGDDDVRVADMNGDGLPDLVRVRAGQVFYWPGRGNGFWGTGERDDCARGTFGQNRHVEMYNAPRFGAIQPGALLLADVNGDGLSDAVEVRLNAVDVYLNDNGAGWADRVALTDVPVTPSGRSLVRLSDIDGSGTPDLVWGQGHEYQYVDLAGGVRPHILTRIENGLGKTTELAYSTSAKLMLEAAEGGSPWASVMPLVVPVVRRVTIRDNLEKVGRPSGAYVTEYTYRDPVFDGRQREFRGFTVAETRSIGDENSPPSITRSTFLLGECRVAQNGFDVCSPADRWKDNWREALKGLPVLIETFDETGVYLTTTHSAYELRQLYSGRDARRVSFSIGTQRNTFAYDTASFAPSAQTVPLDEVIVHADGVVHAESRPVIRRAGQGTAQVRVGQNIDAYGNAGDVTAEGCVQGCLVADETITTHTTFSRPPGDASGWLWRPASTFVTSSNHSEPRRRTFYTYDENGELIRSSAELSGTLPLDRFHQDTGATVASTPSGASGGIGAPVNITTMEYERDDFGNLRFTRGATDRCRRVVFDDDYAQLPTSETIFAGERGADGCGTRSLLVEARFDRGLGVVRELTDVTGQPALLEYDEFGRIARKTFADPDAPGQLAPLPTVSYSYSLPSDANVSPYSVVLMRTQDGSRVDVDDYLDQFSIVDGLGRPLAVLAEADPQAGDGGSFVVDGIVRYDAKGAVKQSFQSFFWTGAPLSFPLGLVPPTSSAAARYDAFARGVAAYGFDGRLRVQTIHHAFSRDVWDAGDLSPGPHQGTYASTDFDGHGRSFRTTVRIRSHGVLEERHTLYEYLPTGEVERITQRTTGTPDVVRWMRYDSLGRMVMNVEPNTSADFSPNPAVDPSSVRAWRYAYNDAGDLVGTSDARGCGLNYHHDAAGRLVAEDYSPCVQGHATYTPITNLSTGAGAEAFYRYDAADPEASSVVDAAGRTLPADSALIAGRLASTSDRGSKRLMRYDARGRTTGMAVRIAQPGGADPAVSSSYAPRWYIQDFVVDSLGRTANVSTGASTPELTGPGGESRTAFSYSRRGRVQRVGSSYGDLVTSRAYSAEGLPLGATLGDVAGTQRTYAYDEFRRVRSVQTFRGTPQLWSNPEYTPPTEKTQPLLLEDLDFEYDMAGNVDRIVDWRISDEWPDFAKPSTRTFEYDDLYRVVRSQHEYAGVHVWQSPFAAENTSSNERRVNPHVAFEERIQEQRFQYDRLGNTTRTTDDANGFFDRSLGDVSNGGVSSGPHQIHAANNRLLTPNSARRGDLSASYDASGNLQDLIVRREGPCLPAEASCWQRFAYDWDELGRISRARRWDLSSSERSNHSAAGSPFPSRSADVGLRYVYTADGQRTLKSAIAPDGDESHAVYIFPTLELRDSAWVAAGNNVVDYALTPATENVILLAGLVRGRVLYTSEELPSANGSRQHLFLQLGDYLGSTTFTLDAGTSELVELSTYQTYGATEASFRPNRWGSFREPYKFSGKEEDIEVGLAYFGARYLSLGLGRWASADPVTIHALGSDSNPYAYVAGRPLSFVDPDGRELVTIILVGIAIGALIAGGSQYASESYAQGTANPFAWENPGQSWARIGIAAGIGGVAGGVSAGVGFGVGGVFASPFWGATIGGAAGGAAGSMTTYVATWAAANVFGGLLPEERRTFRVGELMLDAAVGGGVGFGAGLAGWGLQWATTPSYEKGDIVPTNITSTSPQEGAYQAAVEVNDATYFSEKEFATISQPNGSGQSVADKYVVGGEWELVSDVDGYQQWQQKAEIADTLYKDGAVDWYYHSHGPPPVSGGFTTNAPGPSGPDVNRFENVWTQDNLGGPSIRGYVSENGQLYEITLQQGKPAVSVVATLFIPRLTSPVAGAVGSGGTYRAAQREK